MTNNFSPVRAFNSIMFTGTNYNVHGAILIVTNGIRMGAVNRIDNSIYFNNDIFADVELRAAQTFYASNIADRLRISGNVTLGGNTLTTDEDGRIEISGAISGSAGIEKKGFGFLQLTADNTFSGPVNVRDGRLIADAGFSGNSVLGSTNGVTTVFRGGLLETRLSFTNETLVLSGGGWFNNSSPGNWHGPVNVVSNSTIDAAGDLILDAVLSGNADLSIDTSISGLSAEMILAGLTANTFSGRLQLEEGVLRISKVTPFAGPLIIGNGSGVSTNAVVRFGGNIFGVRQLTGPVTVLSDGTLDLETNAVSGSLTLIGGTVTNFGAGFFRLDGNVKATSTALTTTARIFGKLELADVGPVTRTFFVTNGPAATDLEIHALVSGDSNVALHKDETGTMSLLASNSFQGLVDVSAGTLQLDNDFAFGFLGGDRVVVEDGATLSLFTGANNIAQNVFLHGAGDGGNGALRAVGTVSWNGEVGLSSDNPVIINVANATLNITGSIFGSGGFTKIGPGILRLSGTSGNTYAGNTVVARGILALAKSSGFAINNSAQLVIGDASDNASADIMRYESDNQLRTSVDIVINRTGLLDLNGFTDDVGNISLTGGAIQTGAGLLQLRGNVTAIGDSVSDSSRISGNLDLGSISRTFIVNDGVPLDLIVDAVISGTGGILKSGPGEMELTGSNTFSGAVTVNEGTLIVGNDHALGATTGGVSVINDASLKLSDALVLNEPLTLNSTASNPGALFAVGTSNLWTGNISLTNTARIGVATNTTLNLGGIILGPGGLEKEGDGLLILSGASANSYLGRTVVKTGTLFCNMTGTDRAIPGELVIGDGVGGPDADLVFYSQNQINDLADVTITSSGKLLMGADTIGSLSGTGKVEILNTGELRTSNNNAWTTFDGVILGGGALTKRGIGTFTLTGNNTYTGATTVETGTLQIDGSQPGSDVTVRVNAILAGRGRVGDLSVATGGHLQPGASPGRLTAQSMVLSNGAVLHIELNGPVAGTSYDQVQVNTRPDLTDAKLALSLGGFAPFEGQIFDIIDNRGADADTGTFLGLPGGAVTNANGIPLRINYGRVLGKDVTLTVTNLPLRGTTATVTTGNGDGRVDPNECNLLFLRVTNRNVTALTGIQGTLTTTTPGVIITEATSGYPDLANGAAGTNAVPFQFYTTTGFNCGESIEFFLNVTATGRTPFALRFALQSGVLGTPVTFSNNTASALPGAGTVSSPIAVSGITGGIADVTVSMVLNYPNLSELFILLVPPGGPAIPLAAGLSGSQLGTNCTTAPYVGTFRPFSPLANLDGRTGAQLNGVWQLQIQDLVANSFVGALQCWSITITPAICADGGGICAACNGPFFGSITTNDPAIKAPIQGPTPTPSTCASFNPCAGTIVTVAGPTDVYTFTNSSAAACVTVQLEAPCLGPTNALLSSAVLNGPHFTNCADLLGFSGLITNSPALYSFNLPSNAVFSVTVSGGGGLFGLGLCSNYTLRVDGFECAASVGIGQAGTNGIVVTWPNFAGGYQLQCATNMTFTNALTITNTPVARDGDFVLTNDIAGPRQFYRLRRP